MPWPAPAGPVQGSPGPSQAWWQEQGQAGAPELRERPGPVSLSALSQVQKSNLLVTLLAPLGNFKNSSDLSHPQCPRSCGEGILLNSQLPASRDGGAHSRREEEGEGSVWPPLCSRKCGWELGAGAPSGPGG